MKKSLKSEIAKLKDNKLIAQKSYVTEMFPSLQKEDVNNDTTQESYVVGKDSHLSRDSEGIEGS